MNTDLVIGMAGSGGDGIVSAGESLLTAAALEGYHGVLTKSFGPQIRGGESSFRLRLCTQKVLNSGGSLDIAVALNWEDFLKFGGELPVGGQTVVIYDSRTGIAPEATAVLLATSAMERGEANVANQTVPSTAAAPMVTPALSLLFTGVLTLAMSTSWTGGV